MLDRRELLIAIGLRPAIGSVGSFTQAQSSKVPRIGVLWHAGSESEEA